MNILIKGMEKPKSCYNHCLEGFIANKEIGCPLNDYIESHQYKSKTHPDCPLIEIDTDDPELSAFFEQLFPLLAELQRGSQVYDRSTRRKENR